MSNDADEADTIRQCGLRGEKPTDLSVQQSTRLVFAINTRTAGALHIQIPDTLLAVADEVIE
jgi:putative ABC transport system substrate-binding protein